MHPMRDLVPTIIGQAAPSCQSAPQVLAWILLGSAALGACFQFLFGRRFKDRSGHAAVASQWVLLALGGILTLADVRWHCLFATNTALRLFGFVIAAMGLYILVMSLIYTRRGLSSCDWPKAEGRVLSSKVKTNYGKNTTYTPEVRYEYVVQGKSFTGKRLTYGRAAYPYEDEAQEIADRYSVGEQVFPRYAPDNHGRAVLEPGLTNRFTVAIGAVAGVILTGLGFFLAFTEFEGSSPRRGGRYSAVSANPPYSYIAFAFIFVALGGISLWVHRRKGYYDPLVPTAVVALVMPAWFFIQEFGQWRMVSLRALPFLLVAWAFITLLMYATFRQQARTKQKRQERSERPQ